MAHSTLLEFVMGIIPGIIGIVIPASRILQKNYRADCYFIRLAISKYLLIPSSAP